MDIKSINVVTGEVKERNYTPKELADITARNTAEAAKAEPSTPGINMVNAIKADQKALAALKLALG